MDTADVLALMQQVAEDVITPRFRSLAHAEIYEKGPGDLVTIADHEAEEQLTRGLERAYPDAVVLGEEAYAADPAIMHAFAAAEHAFTIDPIDGTKNFVSGSPDHAVMVSELHHRQVQRAWIWQPQHERAYVAQRGQGATCNGAPIDVPVVPVDSAAWRGVTSKRSLVGHVPGAILPRAQWPMALSWVCCGVDYPQLVSGGTHFLRYGTAQPWDHAPGSLLVSECGGVVVTTDGLDYDPTVRPAGLVALADRAMQPQWQWDPVAGDGVRSTTDSSRG